MGLKRPQLLVPVRLDLVQPGPHGHDRFPAEPEDPHPGVPGAPLVGHDPGRQQHPQVLAH
jgi:hypothetical protein